MLRLCYPIRHDKEFIIAASGGSDSMAVCDFYHRSNRPFKVAYFHHATPQADQFQSVVEKWSRDNNHDFLLGTLKTERPKRKSPEEFWRDERYKFLLSFKLWVITAHHLNDAMETWLFTSMHGTPKLIPSENGLVKRPFLLNAKQQLTDWCVRHNVSWAEDTSNTNTDTPRNRIRHNILPEVLKINLGFAKTIKKKLLEEQSKTLWLNTAS